MKLVGPRLGNHRHQTSAAAPVFGGKGVCLNAEFLNAFKDADRVLVTEIYAAREASEGYSAAQIVARLSHPAALFLPTLAETEQYLIQHLQPGDVLLVLSAGDADRISAGVLAHFTKEI